MLRRPMRWGLALSAPGILFIAVFFAVPVVLLVVASGTSIGNVQGHEAVTAIFVSLSVSLPVVALCTATGVAYASLVVRVARAWKLVLIGVLFLPLLTGEIVSGYGWIILLGSNGLVNRFLVWAHVEEAPLHLLYTPYAVIIGLCGILIPFTALPAITALSSIDNELRLAAKALGATRLKTALFVTFPLIRGAVFSGATIVYALSMSAYAVPAVLGGRQVHTLPLLIYSHYITLFDWSDGSVLVGILLVLVLVPIAAFSRGRDILGREL